MESPGTAEMEVESRDVGDTTKAFANVRMLYRRVISSLMAEDGEDGLKF
jgi:hypothetical protein